MVRYPDQATDACRAVDHELARLLGRTCQFTLQDRVHEAHGKLKVIKEVGDAIPDPERNYDGVSMR